MNPQERAIESLVEAAACDSYERAHCYDGKLSTRQWGNASTLDRRYYLTEAKAAVELVLAAQAPCPECDGMPLSGAWQNMRCPTCEDPTWWTRHRDEKGLLLPPICPDCGKGKDGPIRCSTCRGSGKGQLLLILEALGGEQVGWRDETGKLQRSDGRGGTWTATPPIEPVYRFPASTGPDTNRGDDE